MSISMEKLVVCQRRLVKIIRHAIHKNLLVQVLYLKIFGCHMTANIYQLRSEKIVYNFLF
jgi:hypothetical protein